MSPARGSLEIWEAAMSFEGDGRHARRWAPWKRVLFSVSLALGLWAMIVATVLYLF